MKSIWMGIQPERDCTRVIAMAGAAAEQTLLKARLAPSPASRGALRALMESIALWQGCQVHAALVVGHKGEAYDTSLYHDSFPVYGNALYTLEYAQELRRPHRRSDISGMGRFQDLRQLLLFEVAR